MKTFNDIIGHEGPKTLLEKITSGKRSVHALLFEGPSGIGKRLVALVTAAAYLCNESKHSRPCGNCRACSRMQSGSHLGLWLIDPHLSLDDRDEDDPEPVADLIPGLFEDSTGPGKIGIDPIRNLRNELSLKPSGDPRRAIVLSNFDEATIEAQNALLKTLEEPPANTLILCTAASSRGLPETVVSRCQRIRFHPLPREQTRRVLEKELDLEKKELDFLSGISGGRPGRAIELVNKNAYEEMQFLLEQIRSYGTTNDPRFREAIIDRLSDCGSAAEKRETLRRFFMLLGYFLRDALFLKLNVETDDNLHYPESDLKNYLKENNLQAIFQAVDRLETLNGATEKYVNDKILVENLKF